MEGYSFRRFLKEDWQDINGLYFAEYGIDYPYPLHDHRIDLTLLSTVAEHKDGIVGFARATPFEGHEDVYEFGGLIVAEAHRHRKIAHELTYLRMTSVLLKNPRIIMSEPVCYRRECESQHNLIKYGFVCYGIRPFKYPSIQLHILGEQAETVSFTVRHLNLVHGFETRPVFLPKDYVPFMKAIWLTPSSTLSPEYPGSIPAPIYIPGISAHGRTGSEFVHIPLNWKESLDIIWEYRRKGFLFSGALPGFGKLEDGRLYDYLTLYKPPRNQGMDFINLIHVIPEMDRLKRLMAHEYAATFQTRSDASASIPVLIRP